MKFGLHSVNLHACGYPETAARLARAAEAAGFESLWVADHVVLPDPPMPQRPMAPDMRLLDPVVMLTFYAAHTTRIRLATGVIVLLFLLYHIWQFRLTSFWSTHAESLK